MQERITRINLAVEPPDVLIQPQLGQLKMMGFDQVEYTIEEGYVGVKDKIEVIKALLEPVWVVAKMPHLFARLLKIPDYYKTKANSLRTSK